MTKYVVRDENVLGFIIGNEIQVLRASVIRGASHVPAIGTCYIPMDKTRLREATLADFEAFKVSPKGHLKEVR